VSVITADTFLNVLKPHLKKINYVPEEIDEFYKAQKCIYKTLAYYKDNYLGTEPDFIGGHIISHGFTYFFKEVIVNQSDVVIDLGAAPGDFSAVCIENGAAKVFAFEPETSEGFDLVRTSQLNGNKIEIIRKYCAAKSDKLANSISLDDFVEENHLAKIDFIKADIEGAEVAALIGAKNVLKKYKPKLAFCTYHSRKDEDNIEKVITQANPNYKIYKQKGIIYAY
jgi:23S rRNA U2552 (ribose-2'-O)-methylase RlmE/FtsJ